MGGRGSGGNRVGAGRKRKSALERAISGRKGPRGVVLAHPSAPASSGSTAVAPVTTFGPPAELQDTAPALANLTSQLAFLKQAAGPGEPNPQIAALQEHVDDLHIQGQALAMWHELAPEAFAARTLTPATAAIFVMLCRAIVKERALSASAWKCGGPDHRGLMQRIATLAKDYKLAPLGQPMYAAQPEKAVNPLDRFTKGRA